MIEVENVKVLLLEDADFQCNKDGSDTARLTPEAENKAIFAEVVIFGDRLIKNYHAKT